MPQSPNSEPCQACINATVRIDNIDEEIGTIDLLRPCRACNVRVIATVWIEAQKSAMAEADIMKVVEISTYGAPSVLRVVDRPVGKPSADEVLIRVEVAGVSRPDILQRMGLYPPPPGASDIPGLEVAGTIVECGSQVSQYVPGDKVCALVAGGGYAEYCLAPAVQTLPIPNGWSMSEAATLPENMFTVWENVFRRAGLTTGETILVQGGTSGIGSTAIMLARSFGANVVATAGSESKCTACLSIGANSAINYKEKDFVAETMKVTEGKGADVVLDIIGGAYVQRSIDCLARDGRILLLANPGGNEATFSIVSLIMRRGTILASSIRSRTAAEKGQIADELRREVWPRLPGRTSIRPIVDRQFGFAQASDAHARLERSEHIGKIVLVPPG
jgi:NADPH:quinone reductase